MKVNPKTNLKICSSCREEKDASNYYKSKYTPDKLCRQCKKCEYKYRQAPHIIKRRLEKSRTPSRVEANRKAELKRTYNITLEDYKLLAEKQDYLCKICRKTNLDGRVLSVDHCHKTKKVRGLLCGKCNMGIGMFNDDILLLKEAINYLHKSHGN